MFGAMYQTGYAGLRSCGVTQSISKRSHPLQSEVSLTGLSAAKSFLNELLLRSPGSLAWLPSGVTTRGTITGFLQNRKGSTRLRISGCPSNSSIHRRRQTTAIQGWLPELESNADENHRGQTVAACLLGWERYPRQDDPKPSNCGTSTLFPSHNPVNAAAGEDF